MKTRLVLWLTLAERRRLEALALQGDRPVDYEALRLLRLALERWGAGPGAEGNAGGADPPGPGPKRHQKPEGRGEVAQ